MKNFIENIEKEVDTKCKEQAQRKNNYDNKASLMAAAQTLILNVAVNICNLNGNSPDIGRFKAILSIAAIGIACALWMVFVPKFEYEAPNVWKLMDKYDEIKDDGEKKILWLRESVVRSKIKSIEKNDSRDYMKVLSMGASFVCLLIELIIMLVK